MLPCIRMLDNHQAPVDRQILAPSPGIWLLQWKALGPSELLGSPRILSTVFILVWILSKQVKGCRSLCEWTALRGHVPVREHMYEYEDTIIALYGRWVARTQLS